MCSSPSMVAWMDGREEPSYGVTSMHVQLSADYDCVRLYMCVESFIIIFFLYSQALTSMSLCASFHMPYAYVHLCTSVSLWRSIWCLYIVVYMKGF